MFLRCDLQLMIDNETDRAVRAEEEIERCEEELGWDITYSQRVQLETLRTHFQYQLKAAQRELKHLQG